MRIEKLRLKKLINTRDLGGLPCEGGKIARGLLYRSGKLYALPEKTVRFFVERGVLTIVDLRIETEVNEHPDAVWDGAKYIRLPLPCTATPEPTDYKNMRETMRAEGKRIKKEFGSGDGYMLKTYDELLFSDYSRGQLARFFKILIEADGGVIWHCSGGKDRAGLISMILEGLLGVPEEFIIADFTASAHFQRRKRIFQKAAIVLVPSSLGLKKILLAMMRAPEKYARHALEGIKARYGSVYGYCTQALGLTDGEIQTLKRKYIETAAEF